MDKEKEIEEMAKFILKNRTGEDSEWIANGLYEIGYRKADEVRKETAKRIADWLEEGCFSAGLDTSVFFIAELIRRSYGVEVEE